MAEKFIAQYKVEEINFQSFVVSSDNLDADFDEIDLREILENLAQDHFEQYVKPKLLNLDEFKVWAKDFLAKQALAKKTLAKKEEAIY